MHEMHNPRQQELVTPSRTELAALVAKLERVIPVSQPFDGEDSILAWNWAVECMHSAATAIRALWPEYLTPGWNATCAHCGAGLTLADPFFDIPVCDICAAKPEGV